MSGNLSKKAEEFLSSESGRALAGKKDSIEKLAASDDGQKVFAMLEKNGIENAVRDGDTEALRNAVSGIVNTESGARLLKQLQELMNGK